MLIQTLENILDSSGIANFRQEAYWIAKESPSEETALLAAKRRAAGEPLQYILGNAPFRYLSLDVDSRVLIPRPETESLVEWTLQHAPKGAYVLDIGTGSGAIALSLAFERPDLQVTAADLSPDALDVARHNAEKHGLSAKIEFVHSDIFSALSDRKFTLITANLPYVTTEEYPLLDREVRDFEPKMALVAADCGLALIKRTIDELHLHLQSPGAAIFELSPPQAKTAADYLRQKGFAAAIINDLCGRERFVTGKW